MLFYVFINVFQKMGPRGSVLMPLNLVLSLEVQSGISRFCTSARAGEVPLERGIRASSISALFYSPLERRMWARERNHVSQARASVERLSSGDSTHPALLTVFADRSSVYFSALAVTFVCMSTRAEWPTLERDSVFLKILKLISDRIFASSSHPRHS